MNLAGIINIGAVSCLLVFSGGGNELPLGRVLYYVTSGETRRGPELETDGALLMWRTVRGRDGRVMRSPDTLNVPPDTSRKRAGGCGVDSVWKTQIYLILTVKNRELWGWFSVKQYECL